MPEPVTEAPPRGTRLVLVSEDVTEIFAARSAEGRRLTFEWGEPDEHGWYTPAITEHDDDNLATQAAAAERARLREAVEWMRSGDMIATSFGGDEPTAFQRQWDELVVPYAAVLALLEPVP